ncbi:MAG: molybdopterin molybdotransferase MoeA [Alphaproteobacteria bacterium]|nr:molybdopterin molybdotransferase MoeA [Alphaproteobacteria bacterium]
MAQLTDDCFAFDGPLITAAAALDQILTKLVAVAQPESCPVSRALGRFLAQDVIAAQPIPPYANSAVDGFAVFHADLSAESDTILPIGGRVAAGRPLPRPQKRGEAVQIFTGAPMPKGEDGIGPDTVMMVEDCVIAPDRQSVTLKPGIKQGANCRPAGDDVTAGTVVLTAGTRLRPPEVGMIAACGLSEIQVYAPLSVALFSTGDEVHEPGTPLPNGALYDSNRFTIGAALQALGCVVDDLGILPDDPAIIRQTLSQAATDHTAIVTTGGMSMGEEDHVRATVESLGSLNFWRVAIKPGRPIGMGLIHREDGQRCAVIGLPGNPVAALTTFATMARPVLLTLAGARNTNLPRFRVSADFSYKKKAGRREFVRVRLDGTDPTNGLPRAIKHGRSGAGVLSSLVGADGFVELPEDDTHLDSGTVVDFLPFAEVF